MADASALIVIKVDKYVSEITDQMKSRGVRSANELTKAKNAVLRGKRSGRRYRVPNTRRHYTASAPGEVPAQRTGQYRLKWDEKSYSEGKSVHAQIESRVRTDNGKYNLGTLLEEGSPNGKIAPRPHKKKIADKAKPHIVKIFKEPYL